MERTQLTVELDESTDKEFAVDAGFCALDQSFVPHALFPILYLTRQRGTQNYPTYISSLTRFSCLIVSASLFIHLRSAAAQTNRTTVMSAGGAFGGNRGLKPVPPEKGVFPLDHMHECDLEKKDYLTCLKSSGHQSERCKQFSRKYLECRMEKNLMAKQDMSELGFRKEPNTEASTEKSDEMISNGK